MTIALVDHDKRLNQEKNFSFQSMIAQFDDKKLKFFRKKSKKCAHCKQESHSEQNCWLLHLKLRLNEWKFFQKRKNLIKEDDFETSFKLKIVRTMKIICRADSHTDVWWIFFYFFIKCMQSMTMTMFRRCMYAKLHVIWSKSLLYIFSLINHIDSLHIQALSLKLSRSYFRFSSFLRILCVLLFRF